MSLTVTWGPEQTDLWTTTQNFWFSGLRRAQQFASVTSFQVSLIQVVQGLDFEHHH